MPIVEIKCPKCGSEIEVESTKYAEICPNCKNSFLVKTVLDSTQLKEAEAAQVAAQKERLQSEATQSRKTTIKVILLIAVVWAVVLFLGFLLNK